MKQGGRNIGGLFLLLAWLVIILHSTIAHHHDSDSYFRIKSSECSSHKTTDKSEAHCQAFNNVDADKIITPDFNLHPAETFIFVFVPDFTTTQIKSRAELATFFTCNIILPKQYFSTKLSFRGPPSLL